MTKELDDLLKEMAEGTQKTQELERRKKDVQEKDLTLKEHRVNRDLNELIKNQTELEQAKKINFGRLSPEAIERLVQSNTEYMGSARKAMIFINEDFRKIVPYFRKNLILIGGDTGDGKSTTVANIVFSTITRKNPATGKAGRVLVLSNEEAPEDFYNRITALAKGWAYTNHDKFTDEQQKTFNEYLPIWAKNGRLSIIGDNHEGISGTTTTVEGIERIFENLLKDNEIYDTVILDYYQNVRSSKNNPQLDEYEVQRNLSALLDRMKLRYPGAIVVMAQMKKRVDEEDTTPFNVRLKGSKLICDKCTFICELIPERKLLRSKWFVWKSRFTEAVGEFLYTGYDKGKFVPYTVEFQKSVAKYIEKNLESEKEKELGFVSQDKGEEDGQPEE